MIYNLVDKAIKLSNKQFHNNNIKQVKAILTPNDYPVKFTTKYIKKRLMLIKNTDKSQKIQQKERNTRLFREMHKIKIPFKTSLFEPINNILSKYNILGIIIFLI